MSSGKIMTGYILYAIGIIGGVEGVTRALLGKDLAVITSVAALIVIVIASFMLKPE